jgi:hypothetical protein
MFRTCNLYLRRAQWPRGLRHELSSPAQTLGSWVRIPLEAWMPVCFYCVFVVSCMQVAALHQADPPSEESYRLCIRSRNWRSGQGPTKSCRAIDRIESLLTPEFLSLTHGAEAFLRSCQLCSYWRTSQQFMEPEGSLPCSQEPFTGPYSEPDQSNLYNPILSL